MKRLLSIGIILLFIGMSISSSTGFNAVEQNNINNSNGKTLYVGGSGPNNYTKIQDAINDSENGDTVYVYNDSSPYYENLFIINSIRLIGEDRNTTILDGRNRGTVIWVFADWVNISGFTIQYGFYGIDLFCSNSSVFMNTITHNSFGIELYFNNCSCRGSYNSIMRNSINDNNYGMEMASTDYNNISGNTIMSNNMYGMYIHSTSSYNTITSNHIISNSERGLFLHRYSYYNNIYYNNFINNAKNAYDKGNNSWDDYYPNGGNFWDDYTGNDSDGDGIGDTPYYISGGDNQDGYPLMKPIGNDTIPPITTIELDPPEPDGENGYYVNPVEVTLNATDDVFGVKAIYYRVDGEKWKSHSGDTHTFILNHDCLIDGLIEFYSVDFFENKEEIQSISIDMDKVPPKIGVKIDTYRVKFWWIVEFIIFAKDSCSGMDRVDFFINDGHQETIEGNGLYYVFTIQWSKSLRNHVFYFYCYDRAGNVQIGWVKGSKIKSYPYSQIYNMYFLQWLDRFPLLNQLITRIMGIWIIRRN